jgi:hypothetical protein
MRKIRHPIATFVLSVLAIIALGVGVLAATWHPAVSDGKGGTTLTSRQETALSKVALLMARTNGDPLPSSVEVVASTREEALPVVFPGEMVNGAVGPCYVIEILGNFTALASPPLGAASPKGTVVTEILDAFTYKVEDVSVGNFVADIASLGRVFHLDT